MRLDDETFARIQNARLGDASNPDGLSQGDIVITPDGQRKRVGHIYSDGSYQLTSSQRFFCEKQEIFLGRHVLGAVHLSSGGLECSIDSKLVYIGIEEAYCWTWKDTAQADGGVEMMMPFRLLKIIA